MWKHTVVVCVLLVCSSSALAGAIIDVTPLSPPPYAGGQRVEVQVRLTQQPGGHDIYLREILLDFAETDAALVLDQEFTFDYSGQAICAADPSQCGINHAAFPRLRWDLPHGVPVATVYVGMTEDRLRQIRLPATGSIPVGTIGVTLPAVPGEYLLDVINADAPDPVDYGGRIDFGFGVFPWDPLSTWWAVNGNEIAGGRFTAITTADADLMFGYTPISAAIVPEPAALALLSLGGLVGLCSRKCRGG